MDAAKDRPASGGKVLEMLHQHQRSVAVQPCPSLRPAFRDYHMAEATHERRKISAKKSLRTFKGFIFIYIFYFFIFLGWGKGSYKEGSYRER
jgi:hypothetical protein